MTVNNQFRGRSAQRIGAPTHLANVTPSNSAELNFVTQMIYIGAPGSLKVTTVGGETLTTPLLQVGWHPMEITRVYATGTTASGLMVGW